MTTEKNKVLITGASGYLGRNLCRYFYENGYFVIAQTRDPDNAELKQTSHQQITLDEIFTQQVDFLIHNLALTQYYGNWDDFEEVNINLSKKIFQHFHSIKSLYISSISVLGYHMDGRTLDENSPYVDIENVQTDMYSKSKIIVEKFLQHELPQVSIIRPGLIYGNKKKSVNRVITCKTATVPLVEINQLCQVIEKILLKSDQHIVNAIDHEAEMRLTFEKGNPNVIVIPSILIKLARLIFKDIRRKHQFLMMCRRNRYKNTLYKKLLNELN